MLWEQGGRVLKQWNGLYHWRLQVGRGRAFLILYLEVFGRNTILPERILSSYLEGRKKNTSCKQRPAQQSWVRNSFLDVQYLLYFLVAFLHLHPFFFLVLWSRRIELKKKAQATSNSWRTLDCGCKEKTANCPKFLRWHHPIVKNLEQDTAS